MKISKDSWHYLLVHWMFRHCESEMPQTFCAYLLRLVQFLAMAFCLLGLTVCLLTLIVVTAYEIIINPATGLQDLFGEIIVFSIIGFLCTLPFLAKRIWQLLSKWKLKYCQKIEYV